MNPRPVTNEDVAAFSGTNPEAVVRRFAEPESRGDNDMTNYDPCEGIVHRSNTDGETAVVRVPLYLEPGELTKLLKGGTVWLSMWGGLAPFAVEVVASADDDGTMPHAQKSLHLRESEAALRAAEAV